VYESFSISVLQPNTNVLTLSDDFLVISGKTVGFHVFFDANNKTKKTIYKIEISVGQDKTEIIERSVWAVGVDLENLFFNLKNSLTKI
jgi:hypothetical protein